jgi:cysteinyl-tRNA synthetase
MGPVYEDILTSIGNTPLVRLQRLCPNPKVAIYVKLEGRNPGGSVKDRPALSMIEAAEKSGELTKEKILLEPTSGNTGIGMALVAAVKGYRLLLVLPESVSVERRKVLAALGAEFTLTPGHKGTDGAIEVAYEMARDFPDKFYMPDQYNNEANPLAHYNTTAPEIWEQTQGKITHFVATVGTSGTLMGTSARLKEYSDAVKIVCVEPVLGHKIQGLKNMKEAYVPGIFDKAKLDERIVMEDDEAYETARQLARKEGIFAGMSSGAAVAGAIRLAKELDEGLIVCILPDGGDRYLSTTLFTGVSLSEKEHPVRGEVFLYNTLSRSKERFKTLSEGKATIYSCGPTVDGPQHLGILRRMACTDLLVRLLAYRGFDVTHVMNITDLDDRTVALCEEGCGNLKEFTRANEEKFFTDLDALAIWRAAEYPRASEHIDDMAKLTQKLIDRGFAYEKHRSVYFDITRFPEYGKLSGVNLDEIKVGHTVDLDDYEKENPRDFALFKRASLNDWKKGYSVKTEWGVARPGWHIECAAMSTKYLGDRIDIHTSSLDLLFPHHDNEIAQVEALTNKQFVNTWFHIEMVYSEGAKMASDAGNAVALAQFPMSPRVARFFLLSVHYRKKLHFSTESVQQAASTLARIDNFVRALLSVTGEGEDPAIEEACQTAIEAFEDAMLDDLQISKGLAAIFNLARSINPKLADGSLSAKDAERVLDTLKATNRVLGFLAFEFGEEDGEIEALVKKREQARAKNDFEQADHIRDELVERGIIVEDTPAGVRWSRDVPKPEE